MNEMDRLAERWRGNVNGSLSCGRGEEDSEDQQCAKEAHASAPAFCPNWVFLDETPIARTALQPDIGS